jgi:hypothetical protein
LRKIDPEKTNTTPLLNSPLEGSLSRTYFGRKRRNVLLFQIQKVLSLGEDLGEA